DADDELTPDALRLWLTTLDESGSDFVAGAYVRSRPVGDAYRPGRVQPWLQRATSPRRLGVTLTDHPDASANIVAWSKLSRTSLRARTSVPGNVGHVAPTVAQQMDTGARGLRVVAEVVVHWRVRAGASSITQGQDRTPVLRDYLTALRGG